jgi:hypothetical protein
MGGECGTYGRETNAYICLIRRLKERKYLEGVRYDDKSKSDLRRKGYEMLDWIKLAKARTSCETLQTRKYNFRFHKP